MGQVTKHVEKMNEDVAYARNTESECKMKSKNINRCLDGLRMEDQGERSPQTFLVNNFPSLSSTATKTRR